MIAEDGAKASSGMVMKIILMIMFISGARGVFAYHRYKGNPEETDKIDLNKE